MSATIMKFPSPVCVCGQPGQRRDIKFEGEPHCTIIACDECFDHRHEMLNLVRPVFTMMLECGVDKDIANDVMGYLLERTDP